MRSVGVHITVDFEDFDVSWIVLFRHGMQDEDAWLDANGRFDVLPYRGLLGFQLSGIDFDFRDLNIWPLGFLGSDAPAQGRGQD